MKLFFIPLTLALTANATQKRRRSSSDDETATKCTLQDKHLRAHDMQQATCNCGTFKFLFDLESRRMITKSIRCDSTTYEYQGSLPNHLIRTVYTALDGSTAPTGSSSLSVDPFSLDQLDGNWHAMSSEADVCLEVLDLLVKRYQVFHVNILLDKMCEVYRRAIKSPSAHSAVARQSKIVPMDM